MDFCTPLFGKPLDQLSYQDIVDYFSNEKDENDQREFKSFAPNLADNYPGIIKSICGFLNSNGGILICGAPIGTIPPGKTEKTFQGNLTPAISIFQHDPMISKCSDSIVPLPSSIRLKVLSNSTGDSLCIFEIDESDSAPHQTKGTYYMRLDGQTRPAPHHYIEALFKKTRFPNFDGYIKFKDYQLKQGKIIIDLDLFVFNWSPLLNVQILTCNMMCHPGQFASTTTGRVLLEPAIGVLHFGMPYLRSERIVCDTHAIMANGNTIKITVLFGGRNTPLKSCDYTLTLTNFISHSGAAESLVTQRKENQLFKDKQDELGVTKESTLKAMLGR